MRTQKITVSVIGGHDAKPEVEQLAHDLGKIIGNMGLIVVSGGLDGVMKAVSKGAKEAGGMTIGILPGKLKTDANPYVDIALPTSIGFARNAIVACSADIVVALPGSHGTSSEISYGLVFGRPVIDLGGWNIPGMIKAVGLADAERKLKELVTKIQTE
jgi:hypothetical protein